MSNCLKTLICSLLCLLAVSACKPGVYHPLGDTNAKDHKTTTSGQTAATKPIAATTPTQARMVVPG
jgi:hypothetical protein